MNAKGYAAVTAAYWGFTLTDGALRMLVLLHFHERGMSPITLALLFLLYEFCGVLTNLLGGWWAARSGLKITLIAGLALQVIALLSLSFLDTNWSAWLAISYIMGTQALSGIAKDLTKMSAKSSVKILAPKGVSTAAAERGLLRWVAALTGSKNALKGVGFLVGGILLSWLGFRGALWAMAGALTVVFALSSALLTETLGRSKKAVSFRELFSKTREINVLSFARIFLFASRDVWFVVALPVFLKEHFGWSFQEIGGFMAAWVIGYGVVQAAAPSLVRKGGSLSATRAAFLWGVILTVLTASLAFLVHLEVSVRSVVIVGLMLYGVAFAMNSSLHSYLILAFTDDDKVALNVGFYYMANAWGRLAGTLLSGLIYHYAGLTACLWWSAGLAGIAAISILPLRPSANTKIAPSP